MDFGSVLIHLAACCGLALLMFVVAARAGRGGGKT
jgi:hypothetical protein